jgi:hypothetical protein
VDRDVSYTCVVVADVRRRTGVMKNGRVTFKAPFTLHDDTLLKLSSLPEAKFSLFLKANREEDALQERTKDALRHVGPVPQTQPPMDSDDESLNENTHPKEDERPTHEDSKSEGSSDSDSDPELSTDDESEDNVPVVLRQRKPAQQKPGPKGKKQKGDTLLRSTMDTQDQKRQALAHASRSQQDQTYNGYAGEVGPSRKRPKTRSCAGGQGGESSRNREAMENELR